VGGTILAIWAMAAAAGHDATLAAEMLAEHNRVRTRAGVPELAWSEDLARAAQAWADTLIAEQRFEHQPNGKYGENLYRVTGRRVRPQRVVATWASEAADFDREANRCQSVCGHYTQIVWRTTTEVGCAVARGGSREVWVCEYAPPGNYRGVRPY
jgi:uncharacterized protein YkwD